MSCPVRLGRDRACEAGRRQSGAGRGRECWRGAAAEGGDKAGGKEGAPASESLDTTESEPAKIEEEIAGPKTQRPTTTLSWQDIVVVPRKPFLKGGRLEIAPFAGLTINDNLIRHYVFGRRPELLPDRRALGRSAGTVLRQAAVDAGRAGRPAVQSHVDDEPVPLRRRVQHGLRPRVREVRLVQPLDRPLGDLGVGGVGATITEVIARDPAEQGVAFKNTALTPNVGHRDPLLPDATG